MKTALTIAGSDSSGGGRFKSDGTADALQLQITQTLSPRSDIK